MVAMKLVTVAGRPLSENSGDEHGCTAGIPMATLFLNLWRKSSILVVMKRAWIILLLVALMSDGGVLAQTPSVVVMPYTQRIARDSSAFVRIRVNNIQLVHAYEVQLSYDPLIVRCRSVRGLGFLGGFTFFSGLIDSVNGRTTVNEAILGAGSQTGSGDLVELKFVGLSNGSATLSFTTTDFRDTLNQVIVVTMQGGVIEVGPPNAVDEERQHVPVAMHVWSYPNPFNPSTTIRYGVKQAGETTITIYTILGNQVYSTHRRDASQGTQEYVWKGEDVSGNALPSGTYVVHVRTAASAGVVNVLLLK
jgi:hypothetical protein